MGVILLPVEAEGLQFVHIAAVDLDLRISPQGGGLHQILVPAGGAPRLQLLLNAPQDLLVMRGGDLSPVAPVHLQRIDTSQCEIKHSLCLRESKR